MRKLWFASILLAVSHSSIMGAAPGTDGQYQPRLIESGHTFECDELQAGLRYRQERDRAPMPDGVQHAIRVTLLELSVAGTPLSRPQLAIVEEIFEDFAWIDRVEALCFAGEVYLFVKGMPLREWALYIVDDDRERPQLVTRTLRMSTVGLVEVS